MKRIDKQGSSHLEIIIAFVLFVGFSLFLMMYLEPTQQNTLESSILFGLKNKFFDNTVSNVTIALVKRANATQGVAACVNFAAGGGSDSCKPKEISGFSIAKDVVGQNSCYYYIYSSNEFNPDDLSQCLSVQNYTLGYVEVQTVYSNKSLQDIKNKYYNNYAELKIELGVPETVDFSITSNDYSLTKQIPQEIEVVAGIYRKPVLYSNGSIINQDFIFRIW